MKKVYFSLRVNLILENLMALTEWTNEPSVSQLKIDLHNCKSSHSEQVEKIDNWLFKFKADPLKLKDPTRSRIVPKLITVSLPTVRSTSSCK